MAMPAPHGVGAPQEIRLFGPCEVRLQDAPLPPLRPRKVAWLLALLVLHQDRPVDRDWLAGLLWPDSAQRPALFSLRQRLTDLRRALGSEAGRLLSPTARTLSFDLSGVFCDLPAFDAAMQRGDSASLEAAVGLYRGPLLEGCLEEWILPERVSRAQAYLAALEALAAGAMTAGETGVAVWRLREVVATDPFREGAQRALMEALTAGGEYGAAVQVYRDLRLLLHRELNAQPATATAALFERIRAEGRRKAAASQERPRPEDGAADPASRTRRAPLSPAEVRFRLSPIKQPPAALPGKMPLPLSPMVGREEAVREVRARLAAARLVTLTGTGGVGKTRLAIHVATEAQAAFQDGAWFVELAALSDPELVSQKVAATLEVREQPGQAQLGGLVTLLRDRSLLLVLDNCEHLLEACAWLASSLLAACPDLRILATSRQPLGVPGEVDWRLPSLSLPATTGDLSLEELARSEAVELFTRRAVEGRAGFAMTRSNAAAVAQVCRRLDGIPLAIELAAARMRALTVEQIAARLDHRFHLLTGGGSAAVPRHQTLRATFDWSYNLLDERERALLRRLTVFVGGWTLEAAEAVCAGDGAVDMTNEVLPPSASPCPHLATSEVAGLLADLVDRSLVLFEETSSLHCVGPEGEQPRYRMLETVREYSLDRLREGAPDGARPPEEERARGRHLAYYLGWAMNARSRLYGANQGEWLERMDQEQGNLRAALARSAESDPDTALQLAASLGPFWSMRGHLSEGRFHLEAALQRAGASIRSAARAKGLHEAGILAWLQGDLPAARKLHEESLAIVRELGDLEGIAACLHSLGNVVRQKGDSVAARPLYEESLAIRRQLGDRHGIASTLERLALLTLVAREDTASAQVLYTECLALYRELGDRSGIASTLDGLGRAAVHIADYEGAVRLVSESIDLYRELGDRVSLAVGLNRLGMVAPFLGDPERAEASLNEALVIHRDLNNSLGIAWTLKNLGMAALERGDARAAHSSYEQSRAIHLQLGDLGRLAEHLEDFAKASAALGHFERSACLFGASEAHQESRVSPLGPLSRIQHDRYVALSREALGEEAFASAWAAGQAMTLEQAIASYLEDLGPADPRP